MTPAGAWQATTAPAPMAGARRRALGTSVELIAVPAAALAVATQICDVELESLDQAASRFREDSELSALNRSQGQTVRVGPLLRELLGVALDAARVTHGLVDPTVHQALIDCGYDRDFAALEDDPEGARPPLAPVPGWAGITLFQDRVTLSPGVTIDLGATAKAWAADHIAGEIASATGASVLVGLGGDLAWSGEELAEGWTVRVAEDHLAPPEAPGQTVRMRGAGLATSSTQRRRWSRGGRQWHHLIDPRTGLPSTGSWRTASVAAASCLDANIASTAALVAGADAVPLLRNTGLAARLVSQSGEVLHLGGWPSLGDDLRAISDQLQPLGGLESCGERW